MIMTMTRPVNVRPSSLDLYLARMFLLVPRPGRPGTRTRTSARRRRRRSRGGTWWTRGPCSSATWNRRCSRWRTAACRIGSLCCTPSPPSSLPRVFRRSSRTAATVPEAWGAEIQPKIEPNFITVQLRLYQWNFHAWSTSYVSVYKIKQRINSFVTINDKRSWLQNYS